MILAGEKNDIPFDKKASAATIAAKRGLTDFAIVAVDDGFGIDDSVPEGYGKDPVAPLVTGKPWNSTDNVWAPDVFKLPKKHKGFRTRFCDPDPQNIEKKLSEGWVFANCVDYGMSPKDEDGHLVEARDMILMELPEHLGKQRDKYHADLTAKRTLSNKELTDAARRAEAESGEAAGSTIVDD